MYDPEKIRIFIDSVSFKPRRTRLELKNLPGILIEDELLHGLLEGNLHEIGAVSINRYGYGLMILTDRRVIFYRKKIIGKDLVIQVPVRNLITVNHFFSKVHRLSYLIISTLEDPLLIEHCDKKAAEEFCNLFEARLSV